MSLLFEDDLDDRSIRAQRRSDFYTDGGDLRAEHSDRELLTRANSWRYDSRHVTPKTGKTRPSMPEKWA